MAASKECSTGEMDAIFAYLYASTFRIIVTTDTSPTSLAGCSSSQWLAGSTMGGFPTTDYLTIGSSGNNRYMTIAACTSDWVRNTGVAAAVVMFNVTCSEVMLVTTVTTQTLTAGNKVNIGSWTLTVNQPT